MGYDYDALYKDTPDALGEPTKIFVEFFAKYDGPKLRVLDIGCGQGRDAIFIAKLGHQVTGVDLSPSGIADLNSAALAYKLDIIGVVADVAQYKPDGNFDVVLIDRTLHMLTPDDQIKTLTTLLDHIDPRGWVLIADERSNLARLHSVFDADVANWAVTYEKGGTLFLQQQITP